jgi:uroporphyrinogen III methyltransferase/synthase
MPDEYTASKVADALCGYESIENLRILLLRAEVAGSELPRKLEEMGAIVDDVACYKTVPETEDPMECAARLQAEGADWITFTSSSTVQHFHARLNLKELKARFPRLKFASIGPETTKAIAALGLKADLEAREHTIEGLVKAIETAPTAPDR